jgi:hypothetical protein
MSGAKSRRLPETQRLGSAPDEALQLKDEILQRSGLTAELLTGAGALFGARRGLLSHLFHLGDGVGDVIQAAGLLLRPCRNFVGEYFDLLAGFSNGPNRGGDMIQFSVAIIAS